MAFLPPSEEAGLALDEMAYRRLRQALVTGAMLPGEKLFYERCTVCHVPREPNEFTKTQWHGITQSMFPRAGLDDLQRKVVLDFLEKNAKDAIVP